MPVKIIKKQAAKKVGSNKAPPPSSPDTKLFESHATFDDGKVVTWTFPQPDRLVLSGFLRSEHFPDPFGEVALHQEIIGLAEGLAVAYETHTGKVGYVGAKTILTKLAFSLGARGAPILIEIRGKKSVDQVLPVFRMRLEFNPRKFGLKCKRSAATLVVDG